MKCLDRWRKREKWNLRQEILMWTKLVELLKILLDCHQGLDHQKRIKTNKETSIKIDQKIEKFKLKKHLKIWKITNLIGNDLLKFKFLLLFIFENVQNWLGKSQKRYYNDWFSYQPIIFMEKANFQVILFHFVRLWNDWRPEWQLKLFMLSDLR